MCMKNRVLNLPHTAKQHYGFLRICRLQNECAIHLQHQAGFTLLELLVVIGLLAIVTVGSMTLLIDDGNWKRAIETEQRWDHLRKAIVGESNQSLNGAPYVSGYVADMGRLPQNIQELFIQESQPDWTELDLYVAGTGFSSALSGGWRGPYLYTAGSREYRDGWNNRDLISRDDGGAVEDDAINFGWVFTPTDTTDLAIQSLGADNKTDGSEIDADYPADNTLNIVNEHEWLLSDAPISFTINFSQAISAAQTGLALRLYRYVDSGDATADFTNDIEVVIKDDDANGIEDTFDLVVSDISAPVQTLTVVDGGGNSLPAGRFAAVIWCTQNTPSEIDDTVYDGNCDATNNHNPVYFTLTPYTSDVTIRWNLP